MQKILGTESAYSYKREDSEDIFTKDKYTTSTYHSGKNTSDKDTPDKNTPDKNTTDKNTTDKDTTGKDIAEKDAADSNISGKAERDYFPADHVRDANSRTIFSSQKLTCQFLRDYTGLPIFADLQPEDIEDVTDRYRAFLGVEFEADTVKKVRVRLPGEKTEEVFVIPLVEHKTRVDYDVAMQLLRYMAVIWYDHKKQQEGLKKGSSSQKGFRYPPIIPIVYFEGKSNWTADMKLSDRIGLSERFQDYIPDFTYKVVRVHGYRNEDLKEKHNEMSLVMMLNRIQSAEDYTEFLESSREYVDEIYDRTPEDIRAVYREVLWALFQKMNVPVEEAREKLAKMEENGMGYLFADMEKMDIQAERRNTETARREAEAVKLKLEAANQELEATNQELEASNQKLEAASGKINSLLSQLVSICQSEGLSRKEAMTCLQERYGLSYEDAVSATEQFWKDS